MRDPSPRTPPLRCNDNTMRVIVRPGVLLALAAETTPPPRAAARHPPPPATSLLAGSSAAGTPKSFAQNRLQQPLSGRAHVGQGSGVNAVLQDRPQSAANYHNPSRGFPYASPLRILRMVVLNSTAR